MKKQRFGALALLLICKFATVVQAQDSPVTTTFINA
jgi:hypothetical protein